MTYVWRGRSLEGRTRGVLLDLCSWSATAAVRLGDAASAVGRFLARPRWWLEILLVLGVYQAYSRVRNAGGHDVGKAFADGRSIAGVEEWLHIDIERRLNGWVHRTEPVADISALEYHTLHWWVTIGVVVWLFWRRRDEYRKASLVLALTTLLALAGFYLMPTAPPRMFPGYVDIMAQTASWGWWEASGSPGPQSVTNEFAAMPSLHCGWAIWCGLMIVLYARRTWVRVLGAIYPPMIAFVVIGTANHYVLDVVAIIAVIAVAMIVVHAPWKSLWQSAARRTSAVAGQASSLRPPSRGAASLGEVRSPDRPRSG